MSLFLWLAIFEDAPETGCPDLFTATVGSFLFLFPMMYIVSAKRVENLPAYLPSFG
jgi:hypothetical protein